MTVDERLRHVSLKIERAKRHIADLNERLIAFGQSKPYRIGVKRDPQTRRPVYYVASVDPIPDDAPLIAGDAIQNLTGALDHLAYQLVCSDTGDDPPNRGWIYFPIRNTAEEYETTKRKKMKGARQETFDAIDALKPYKGGNDLLWMLARLNTIEKHRLLLTVATQVAGFDIARASARAFTDTLHPTHLAAMSSVVRNLIRTRSMDSR